MSQSLSSLSLLLPCLIALCAPAAHANTISGVAYCNISAADAASTPVPGATHSGTECATFTASTLVFYSNGSSSTNNLGGFRNADGAIVGPINYLNGYTASSTLDDSFFEFTGIASFNQGETYNVYHDDGTVMTVNGVTVLNAPAPTSLTNTPFVFNGPSGNYNFDYTYTEQGGTSAYGTDADASPTPEPTSLILLGTGTAFLFLAIRRNRNQSFRQIAP